jgi:hypothetical protein
MRPIRDCEAVLRTARGDVAAPECLVALGADEVEPAEIVSFAERGLLAVRAIDGEEFGGDYGAAILRHPFNGKTPDLIRGRYNAPCI